MRKLFLLAIALVWLSGLAKAQDFFNLTADEVKISGSLPWFTHSFDIGKGYADSTYSVEIEYPEFVDMTAADVARYHNLTTDSLPTMPTVYCSVGVARKRGQLDVSFVPLVFRNGKFQKLVSFKLAVKSRSNRMRRLAAAASQQSSSRYADHSVLSSGTWAKIRVSASGVHQLTDDVIRNAGFSDPNKVKLYGYGGALQPETLSGDYLTSTDDLKEVPLCIVGGRRLFYAQGPVSWTNGTTRVRNPYSDYGYYFLTESETGPTTVDESTFLASFYPSGDDNNTLYEVDNYAWYHGGRNLYDSKTFSIGATNTYSIKTTGNSASGTLTVVLTANAVASAKVSFNGSEMGTVTVAEPSSSDKCEAAAASRTFTLNNISADNTVQITQTSGGTMLLDYIVLHTSEPKAAPNLSADAFPAPEYVCRITNQDHHSDASVNAVILIPASQKLRKQAERLKTIYETLDGMTVRIVPADELFNEYSSGTPDATAYRRYMKMLYDRAESDTDMPKYLVLFGDGAWDNRMHSSVWSGNSPDDYLLCFESENSFSEIYCYVSDDFYCMLDDNEAIQTGSDYKTGCTGKPDVAVGRFPVRTADEANVMLDKIEAYRKNTNAGYWQNTIVVMGDDGNNNTHMDAANEVAKVVETEHPTFDVRRIMWDTYKRETTSTGERYPEVAKLIGQYMTDGTLIMNYNGHGSATQLSHEAVVTISDFSTTASKNLPLWVTASCDIMPFDGQTSNIGETALFNSKGGAVAFFGTTRTVYTNYNLSMNKQFTHYVLGNDANGSAISVGEAARLAKNALVTSGADNTPNKLQYSLLGDPALVLAYPRPTAVIDSINGEAINGAETPLTLKAGSVVRVKGRVLDSSGAATGFSGRLTAVAYDALRQITGRLNNTNEDGASTAYVYEDRTNTIYKGNDSVRNGQFELAFAVPKDISYSDGNGRLIVFGVGSGSSGTVSGYTESLVFNGSEIQKSDSLGPSIYCYLNSSSFANGGTVNTTPYFVAQISDEDGINASGGGVGHDLKLVIDGDMNKTYVLNDYFAFDFGSYTSGTVGYSIPALDEGMHKLQFRAWDVLNNSSVAELSFYVSYDASPALLDVESTANPATTATSFRIIHDRVGSEVAVTVDVYDMAGRRLWSHNESMVPTSGTITVDWDLATPLGGRVGTGVYLYRARLDSGGASKFSPTKKLIVLSNK